MKQEPEYYWHKSVKAAAERLLREVWGAPVRLGEPAGIWVYPDECRPTIQRALVLEGPAGAPESVILKRIHWIDPYDPDNVQPTGGTSASYDNPTMAWRLASEWTATQFLSLHRGEPPLFPACYGGDLAEGFVILGDLGTGETGEWSLFARCIARTWSTERTGCLWGHMVAMGEIEAELRKALSALNLSLEQARFCSPEMAQTVLEQAKQSFVVGGDPVWWWDALKVPSDSIPFPEGDGFRHVTEYVPTGEERCWLVVEGDAGVPEYVLDLKVEVVPRIIGECYGFEYYLIGRDFDWLVCENHHDTVMVATRPSA